MQHAVDLLLTASVASDYFREKRSAAKMTVESKFNALPHRELLSKAAVGSEENLNKQDEKSFA